MTATPEVQPGISGAYHAALTARAKAEICAVCETKLDVAVQPEPPPRRYVLRCNKCGVNEPDTRPLFRDSNEKRFKRGEPLTMMELMMLSRTLSNRMRREEARTGAVDPRTQALWEEVEMAQGSNTTALTLRPATDITQAEALRFVDLSKLTTDPGLREIIADLAVRTGLNPMLGEITIYEGRPYVTVDGCRRALLESNFLKSIGKPRFLSQSERDDQGYLPDEIVVEIPGERVGVAGTFYGVGKASRTKPYRNNPAEVQNPQRFAMNRAFRHLFKQGWQDVLSGNHLELLPEGMDEGGAVPAAHAMAVPSDVDAVTGEILESQMAGHDAAPPDHADETDRAQTPADRIVREAGALGWSVEQIGKSAQAWFRSTVAQANDAQVDAALAMLRRSKGAAR